MPTFLDQIDALKTPAKKLLSLLYLEMADCIQFPTRTVAGKIAYKTLMDLDDEPDYPKIPTESEDREFRLHRYCAEFDQNNRFEFFEQEERLHAAQVNFVNGLVRIRILYHEKFNFNQSQ